MLFNHLPVGSHFQENLSRALEYGPRAKLVFFFLTVTDIILLLVQFRLCTLSLKKKLCPLPTSRAVLKGIEKDFLDTAGLCYNE